ncbi:hypothetical protein GCM10027161_77820 [Microbispora hainanensis]
MTPEQIRHVRDPLTQPEDAVPSPGPAQAGHMPGTRRQKPGKKPTGLRAAPTLDETISFDNAFTETDGSDKIEATSWT